MHTSNEEWISVSHQGLNEVASKEQRGIKLQFMSSPADLPTAWRVLRAKENMLVVEFKYLSGSEAKCLARQDNGVVLEVGKNSKRIYRIILDVLRISSSGEIFISNVVDALEHSRGLNKGNSNAIHKFLTSKKLKPEILERIGE